MSHKIVWKDSEFKIITTDVLDDDFINSSTEVTSDPRFINAKYGIVDFRTVEDVPIASSIIKQLAISNTSSYKLNPNIKLAILANKLVITGLVHIYKSYFELHNNEQRWEIMIFQSEDEARKWFDA